jgi:hypothetical protein
MGEIARREQIEIPNDYWVSSLEVEWVYING